MRCVLHIGTEKTGTTAVQSFLFLGRERLAELGVHVATSPGERNNRWIAGYAMSPDRDDDFTTAMSGGDPERRRQMTSAFLARFHREMSSLPPQTHTVVLTSEHLHSRLTRQEEVDAVGDLLDRYFDEITVVCYLRRQVDVCVSLYSTALKVGHVTSLPRFLDECTPDNPYYDYDRLLRMWEQRFTRAALDVRLFDKSRFLNGDLLDDVCAVISPQLVGAVRKVVDDPNESLTPSGQALARAVNRLLGGRDDTQGQVREIRAAAFDLLAARLAGKGQQPSAERWALINESFREINENVRERFFPDITADLFPGFPPASPPVLVGDIFVDTVVELMKLLRGEAAPEG